MLRYIEYTLTSESIANEMQNKQLDNVKGGSKSGSKTGSKANSTATSRAGSVASTGSAGKAKVPKGKKK